eukprot:9960343-Alexandrium_andersonii.AAC.1
MVEAGHFHDAYHSARLLAGGPLGPVGLRSRADRQAFQRACGLCGMPAAIAWTTPAMGSEGTALCVACAGQDALRAGLGAW